MSIMMFKDLPTRSGKSGARQPAVIQIRRSPKRAMWRMARYPETLLIVAIFLASWYFGAEAFLHL